MSRLHLDWVRRGAGFLIFLAVLEYLVLPQIAGTRRALHLLGDVQPGWIVAGVALEALSLISYSMLTRSVLPDQRPAFSWLMRSDLTGLGVGHIVPGGAVAASTLRYRLLREGGAPAEDAAVGTAVEGIGSTVVLIAILWLALILSIPFAGIHLAYVVAAGIGAVIIALAVGSVVGISHGGHGIGIVIHRVAGWLPGKLQNRVESALTKAATQLAQLLADRHALRNSAVWATGNWLFDAAALWVFLAAYGWQVNPVELMVGYGLANVLAVLPVSPGGLGIVEGVVIPCLVGFGVPRGEAVLGVVSWRLFEFWAPIPVAGVCYLSLRTQNWRDHQGLSRAWREFATFFTRHAIADPVSEENPADTAVR